MFRKIKDWVVEAAFNVGAFLLIVVFIIIFVMSALNKMGFRFMIGG